MTQRKNNNKKHVAAGVSVNSSLLSVNQNVFIETETHIQSDFAIGRELGISSRFLFDDTQQNTQFKKVFFF